MTCSSIGIRSGGPDDIRSLIASTLKGLSRSIDAVCPLLVATDNREVQFGLLPHYSSLLPHSRRARGNGFGFAPR